MALSFVITTHYDSQSTNPILLCTFKTTWSKELVFFVFTRWTQNKVRIKKKFSKFSPKKIQMNYVFQTKK